MSGESKAGWLESVARLLKRRDSRESPAPAKPTGPTITWEEWFNPNFPCRNCPETAETRRGFVPIVSGNEEGENPGTGLYGIEPLGCEEGCPRFREWRAAHPPGAASPAQDEILWKEWLDPAFCCRRCPDGAVKVRTYVPRVTERDKDDVLEGGAYAISTLGCEGDCLFFRQWRAAHPIRGAHR